MNGYLIMLLVVKSHYSVTPTLSLPSYKPSIWLFLFVENLPWWMDPFHLAHSLFFISLKDYLLSLLLWLFCYISFLYLLKLLMVDTRYLNVSNLDICSIIGPQVSVFLLPDHRLLIPPQWPPHNTLTTVQVVICQKCISWQLLVDLISKHVHRHSTKTVSQLIPHASPPLPWTHLSLQPTPMQHDLRFLWVSLGVLLVAELNACINGPLW